LQIGDDILKVLVEPVSGPDAIMLQASPSAFPRHADSSCFSGRHLLRCGRLYCAEGDIKSGRTSIWLDDIERQSPHDELKVTRQPSALSCPNSSFSKPSSSSLVVSVIFIAFSGA
jgi:hypothetical protein